MKPYILITRLLLTARFVLAEDDDMGAVGFLWPTAREWSASQDTTPPCGSAAGVTNRTDFPLSGGEVALIAQDESWYIQIAISVSNDPTSNDDFEVVTQSTRIQEMDEGHMCYPVSNPGSDSAGSNATIQIRYTSEFDTDTNSTYYACADITYVATSDFTIDVPCFNVTIPETSSTTTSTTASTASTAASRTASATSSSSSSSAQTSHSSSGLSGGAIAGTVVGVVCGVALIFVAMFFLWRRGQKYKRMAALGANPRKVDWKENDRVAGSLQKEVELNDVSGSIGK